MVKKSNDNSKINENNDSKDKEDNNDFTTNNTNGDDDKIFVLNIYVSNDTNKRFDNTSSHNKRKN